MILREGRGELKEARVEWIPLQGLHPSRRKRAFGKQPEPGPNTRARRSTGGGRAHAWTPCPRAPAPSWRVRKAGGFLCGVSPAAEPCASTSEHPRPGQRGRRGWGGSRSRLIDSPKSDLVKEPRSQWEAAIHQFGLEAPGGEVEEKPPN